MNYSDYLAQAQRSAQAQQSDYEAKRKQQLKKVLTDLEATASKMNDATRRSYGAAVEATKRQTQQAVDRNAVREAVSRKTVAEQMANLGLSDSGLNRTQQTAVSTARSHADALAATAEQQAIQQLQQELFTALAGNEQWLGSRKAEAEMAAESDIQKQLAALNEQAEESATAQFNASLAVGSGSSGKGGSSSGSSYSENDLVQYVKLLGENDRYVGTPFYAHYIELVYALRKRLLGR